MIDRNTWIMYGVLALVLFLGGFIIGYLTWGANDDESVDDKAMLKDAAGYIAELEEQIIVLKQEVALLETHREVDREAYELVEDRFAELEQKIQEQSEAIAFYRGIVSPKDGGRGLRLQDLKLTRGREERHNNVRLVLLQVKHNDRSVKGEVAFSLAGELDGVATTFSLEQLIPEDANGSWPFAFRYFQDFDRELVLPEGFMPEKINIEVISRTKSIAIIELSFDWLERYS